MSPPAGQIRPYSQEDEKPVRFMIGKAKLEGLATANKKGEYSLAASLVIVKALTFTIMFSSNSPSSHSQHLGRSLGSSCRVHAMVAET